jgi:outer membrane immunogenic protein
MHARLAYLIAGTVALGITSHASAADMRAAPVATVAPLTAPLPSAYDWSGVYFGIHGGWGNADYDHTFNTVGHYNLRTGDTLDYSGDGGVLGGHIGYNWQFGQWVAGVEGAITKTWLDSGTKRDPFFNDDRWHSELDWIGAVTGRLGFATNNWLWYGKAGWAWSRVHDHVEHPIDFVDQSRDIDGWTAGLGLEYGWTNWVLGIEYNHYDFGAAHVAARRTNFVGRNLVTPGTNHDLDVTVDTLMARLSYKWNGR